ncbi:MAG: 16S rRNA processing protein RimM [Magnetococcales bacterium]|nr:16S rRNA processing protein RimM [Magnetococcales bacterium]
MTENNADWVSVGRLQGPFGVKGWVRVLSSTDPPERILTFADWWLGEGRPTATRANVDGLRKVKLLSGQRHTRGVVVHLEGVDTPDAAQLLSGLDAWVARASLPEPAEGEHYWADMIGARVVEADGRELGVVAYLFATGANDVLVVQEPDGEERLLPFTREVVQTVDVATQTITVCLMSGM